MTKEVFFLRFLWGPRPESLKRCAGRLDAFLSELRSIDNAFAAWRRDNTTAFQVPLGVKRLEGWLAEGVNRNDVGKEVIAELGFALSLTSSEESTLTLRVNCGVYSSWTNNCCSIEFPSTGKVADRILRADILTRVAKATVLAWQPDHGVITSHQCSARSQPPSFLSEAGWITYLSEKYNHLSQLPSQLTTENIVGGRLVVATSDRFDSTNAQHMKPIMVLTAKLSGER